MALRFLDTFPGSGVFASVEFDVAGPALPPPDAFRVEAGGRGLVRITLRDRPVLWARVDRYWQGVWLLARDGAESPGIVAPWRFDDARGVVGRREPERHGLEWAKRTAGALRRSPLAPLHAGTFRLTRLRGEPGRFVAPAERVAPERHAFLLPGAEALHTAPRELGWQEHFGVVLPLRAPSPASSARRHAWRKAAREGWLPPVLLHWVSGLNAYGVLDGHDRLAAAGDEGVAIDALALWA
ncbi:hypothetical protein EON77_19785, partial [bacterium]